MSSAPDQPNDVPDPWAPPADAHPGYADRWPTPTPAPGPMPMAWPPTPAPAGWNGYAVTSFVLGVFGFACCLWAVAIAFGIAALKEIPKRNQRGRGLAITGMVLSVLWVVVSVLVGIGAAVVGHRHAAPLVRGLDTPGTVSALSLKPGDCFEKVSQGMSDVRVRVVRCTEPHYGEVFARAFIGDLDYPGEKQLTAEVGKLCNTRVSDYAVDTWALPDSVEVRFFQPEQDSWDLPGGNWATCMFVDQKGERTGSLKQNKAALTSEQAAYLRAVESADNVSDQAPDAEVADDPAAYHSWAGMMHSATEEEVRQLESTAWSDRAKQPVADLVAELKLSLPHLAAAQTASDPNTLERELDAADDHDGHEQAMAVRAALGLATGAQRPAHEPAPAAV